MLSNPLDISSMDIKFLLRRRIRYFVTIQPYKLSLLIAKVHFVAFYETFMANVLRYRFHEYKDIIYVGVTAYDSVLQAE